MALPVAPGADGGAAAASSREDLRMPAIGLAAWAGGLAGLLLSGGWLVGVVLALWSALGVAGWVAVRVARRGDRTLGPPGRAALTWLALLLTATAVATAAQIRVHRVAHNPLTELAQDRAAVTLVLRVSADPHRVPGRFGDLVILRARVSEVAARGASYSLGVPVLVVAGPSWAALPLGATVRAEGRLAPPEERDVAVVFRPFEDARTTSGPAWWWRASDRVRASLRASVSGVPADRRPLVPALVLGDDRGLDVALADDFRTTGLTHLLAVSGTNLTLVVGFVLVAARWVGLRGRWRYALGAAGIVGFVLLARPEPSVLRAAVMGGVGLLGLGAGGRRRGGRALGVAVTALLLVDPWLAPTPGFALSVLATAGIVFLAPAWREALACWLPRWLAEALAVPAAAQLACTPVVAGLSGQVSLVAVGANLLAAPAVGPATVLGLAGGLAGLAWEPLGRAGGTAAGWCVGWIVAVAEQGAALPLPAVESGSGPMAVALLTLGCGVTLLLAPALLRRRGVGVTCCLLLVVVVLVRPPTPGWPPPGWVLVACDVGQGDALVLRAGPGSGVVIDAGPDPARVDSCLRRLRITRVPLLVVTHFHADHVDGLAGVFRGRAVDAVEVTPLADPPGAARAVAGLAGRRGVPVEPSAYGVSRQIGDVTVQCLWPPPGQPSAGPGDGSTANDASVVLLAQVRGVRLLLTGDVEPPAQEAIARSVPGLTVDVLKVPHHGSRFQDLPFLTALGARVALVSAGEDNDYGHPAPDTLAALEAAGVGVLRTDRGGDLVVLVRDGRILTRTAR